ncbi:hypothetical protein BH11ACT1_BH11ACT1_16760 [soil metagenome]
MTMADPPQGPEVPKGSVPAMSSGRLRVLAVVALSGAVVGVAIIVASAFPGTGPASTRLWPWLFGMVFPIFAIAVVTERAAGPRRAQRRRPGVKADDWFRELLRWLPPGAGPVLRVVLALGVVNFVIVVATTPGQPETENGRHYANIHGSLTELTAPQFDSAERAEARGFAGHAVMLDSIGAAILMANSRRRRYERAAGTV